jgi:hypothetical protein
MSSDQYPSHVDFVWIACDRCGEVAAFATGGEGPIPKNAFPQLDLDPSPEELVLAVPALTGIEVVLDYCGASSFEALAARGFHVYDWTDVHKSAAQATRSYGLIARPLLPSYVSQLPRELAALAASVLLPGDSFANVQSLTVDGITPQPLR